MSSHAPTTSAVEDRIKIDEHHRALFNTMRLAAIIGIVAAVVLGFVAKDEFRRFYFGYLASLAYITSIALGALAFVLLQHLTQAGWSVTVRRTAENIAATLPVLGIATIPILASVMIQNGDLYPWALNHTAATKEVRAMAAKGEIPEEEEALAAETKSNEATAETKGAESKSAETKAAEAEGVPHRTAAGYGYVDADGQFVRQLDVITWMKRGWLNPIAFLIRIIAYFAIWSWLSYYFWHESRKQDQTGDAGISLKLKKLSAPGIVLMGLTVSFAAFDLLMSLDPHWYSTMFGVYYIAGCLVSSFAAMIVITYILQRNGYLLGSISIEHYHDLGKFLFAFTFFWGYIAFSQYMLLWYANLPETVPWLSRRGVSAASVVDGATGASVNGTGHSWTCVAIALLVGKLFIPYAGLISRHIKRRPNVLVFWACWILVFHFIDMYWVVLPEYGVFAPKLVDLACLLGLGSLFIAFIMRNATEGALRPTQDPFLPEALAFQNI